MVLNKLHFSTEGHSGSESDGSSSSSSSGSDSGDASSDSGGGAGSHRSPPSPTRNVIGGDDGASPVADQRHSSGGGSERCRGEERERAASGSSSRSSSAASGGSGSRSGSPRERAGSRSSGSSDGGASGRSSRSSAHRSGSGSPPRAQSDTQQKDDGGSSGDEGSQSDDDAASAKRKRGMNGSDSDSVAAASQSVVDVPTASPNAEGHKKLKTAEDGTKSPEEDAAIPDAADLFGDASDISDDSDAAQADEKDDEAGRAVSTRQVQSDADDDVDDVRRGSDYEEEHAVARQPVIEEDEEEGGDEAGDKADSEQTRPLPETRIEVDVPKINTDLGKELNFVKLPNFLSVETHPFDPETYEDEVDEEETMDEEGRARLKLRVENTIRWRTEFNDTGDAVRESNAKMVRWSDGSLSLYLGSEIFDVYKQPLQGDHNHLFIRQGTGLQGQAVFRTKLTFRPHSTDSFTHRKMTRSIADRSHKTAGVRVLTSVGQNPDLNRSKLIKQEEIKLRASVRREAQRRRIREKTGKRMSAGFLEADAAGDEESEDEEGVVSLSAIKNKYKHKAGEARAPIYSSDDEDEDDDEDNSDIEANRANKLERAKKMIEDSEEEDGESGSDKEEDSDS